MRRILRILGVCAGNHVGTFRPIEQTFDIDDTAGCSTCAGLRPLSNQHFQASITSTLQSIVGSAVVAVAPVLTSVLAPVLGFYSGSCSRVLFWLLF
jgi:hypothetical protein